MGPWRREAACESVAFGGGRSSRIAAASWYGDSVYLGGIVTVAIHKEVVVHCAFWSRGDLAALTVRALTVV